MMLKQGVNPLGMRPEILIAAIVANEVYAVQGHNLVITSITDGKHGSDSYHYKGMAIDCRTHYFSGPDEIIKVASSIVARLGSFYDVVIESDHIHIEFDATRAQA
ncbi:MAG TPA: hypothetical protein V6D20_01640 [Candidatus Obscuribacterales bacterium]